MREKPQNECTKAKWKMIKFIVGLGWNVSLSWIQHKNYIFTSTNIHLIVIPTSSSNALLLLIFSVINSQTFFFVDIISPPTDHVYGALLFSLAASSSPLLREPANKRKLTNKRNCFVEKKRSCSFFTGKFRDINEVISLKKNRRLFFQVDMRFAWKISLLFLSPEHMEKFGKC